MRAPLLSASVLAALVLGAAAAPAGADRLDDTGECHVSGPTTVECGAKTVVVTPPEPSAPAAPGEGPSGGGGSPAKVAPSPAPPPPLRTGCSSATLSPSQAAAEGLPARSGGSWVRTTCTHLNDDRPPSPSYWFRSDGGDGTPAPSSPPASLVQEARDSLELPAPAIRMNPRVRWEQVVNLASWLWVDRSGWRRQRAEAEAGEVVVSATAVPTAVVWDLGDGTEVTCPGPGTPYDPDRPPESQTTDCSHTYRRSSGHQPGGRYSVTATVLWHATWTSTGIEASGDLGTMRTEASVRVRVVELQALNQ